MNAPESVEVIQKILSSLKCRIIPTSFEADDPDLAGFPLHPQWHWDTCAQALSELKPHGVMMRLPLFWQLEVPLWYACRTASAPIFLNDPENMPVGAAALRHGGIDTVVTEQRDAAIFAAFLRTENTPVPGKWVIVHRASDTWDMPASLSGSIVAQEVHLFPGLPILSQCTVLMTESSGIPRFHVIAEYRYDPDTGTIAIPAKDAVPAFALKMPPITASGTCACGNTVYTQTI